MQAFFDQCRFYDWTETVLGGELRIEDTRIGVLHVYGLVVEGDNSLAEVVNQLDLSLGQIYSALAYYHEHPEEMHEIRRRHAEPEKRLASEALEPPEIVI